MPTAKGKAARAAHVILINIGILIVGVIALELIFGRWFAPYHPPSGSIFYREFKLEQRKYQPFGLVTYIRDKYGLRGPKVEIDKIELVTVGGSTTDEHFITEGETWQDVLYAASGLRVTNAGDEGISSTGHVVAVRDWLHLIPGLHAKHYLHYIGVNDAVYAEAWRSPNAQGLIQMQLEDQANRRAVHRFLRGRSALVQGYIRFRDWLGGPPPIFSATGFQEPAPGPETIAKVDERPISEYIERIYRPNLLSILDLHRERGERVIFVSQTARPSLFRRDGNVLWVRNAQMAGFLVALSRINEMTERVCRAADNCDFIDLASELRLEDADFYDLVHTTPSGSRKIGTFLADALRKLIAG